MIRLISLSKMKKKLLAIHHRPGSYSNRWIAYCNENNIDYKLVDCTKPDIIKQLDGCAGLIWQWDTTDYSSYIFAKQLTYSLLLKGIKVFPDKNTSWHYDDKVGQKYLLEAIGAPLVRSYVFYSRREALKWANSTSYPKVFKLRGGAGSSNVRLANNKQQTKRLINKAFTAGFPHKSRINRLKQRVWVLKRDQNLHGVKQLIKGIGRFMIPKTNDKFYPKQKGYVYFQDFIPDNNFDTRTVVIGNRCFGARRYCRTDDFRASGSGIFTYNPGLVNEEMILISFDVARKLKTQSLAFDFIIDNKTPKIIEISYCFAVECCDDAPGYWDKELKWHAKDANLQEYIIQDFLNSLQTADAQTLIKH